ncbi:hypothetical protein KUTeg_016397 [Tegillarca granosa]|uniref:Uncharacterized protein n=1 Tax=Tegillarca granosa TaxID=220873 RepID=A0ABQ9EPI9_TEGGR|nr:hypothetical protein KUTeg_016397 [Tegillarca granosa]
MNENNLSVLLLSERKQFIDHVAILQKTIYQSFCHLTDKNISVLLPYHSKDILVCILVFQFTKFWYCIFFFLHLFCSYVHALMHFTILN